MPNLTYRKTTMLILLFQWFGVLSLVFTSVNGFNGSTIISNLTKPNQMVTIRNDIPRVDQWGTIVNAHDGVVVRFDDLYYMYGTAYANCTQVGAQCDPNLECGFHPNTYALYTSPDLEAWTLVSRDILPSVAVDNVDISYWMPLVHRRGDGKYVLQFWSRHCGFTGNKCTEVAFSDTPQGPFVNVTTIPLVATVSSTMGFFLDDDGSAYIKYNTRAPDNHHVIEKLNEDWTNTTGEYAILLWKPTFAWLEGGGMFRRGDLYYYMTGLDNCFATWGSDARYWTSRAPLGPWHPGMAPPLPTESCDLSGDWLAISDSPDAPGNGTVTLLQEAGSANFTATGFNVSGAAGGWVDSATGYVNFPPMLGDVRGVITSADGSDAGCDRVRWYGFESFVWCKKGADCALPSYHDATEVNFCADGHTPVEDNRDNPCDVGNDFGMNFTVPAQMFNVIVAPTVDLSGAVENTYIFYGERFNSAPDGLFSHGYQAWVPLVFDASGNIEPMTFPASFQLNLTFPPNARKGL